MQRNSKKDKSLRNRRMIIFLYTVGSVAATGILISIFLLMYIFTSKDVLEVLIVSAMISAMVTIPMFVKLEEITFLLKGRADDRD